ncbi:predicted protein [Thalassiosira pseudonana CCMP1335]|jgi:hypothetical protein|uniref:Uncharacterized protein n=1 Tax=Thalassiosira pseudonana TaxID=35128 RepID=B5YM75_THAPS|nr:predicted protein [Thalassiosira pseudonana CCMP1335]ACI64202.1 predicted protein [Thalassiosira pseudonana CCMP1335]
MRRFHSQEGSSAPTAHQSQQQQRRSRAGPPNRRSTIHTSSSNDRSDSPSPNDRNCGSRHHVGRGDKRHSSNSGDDERRYQQQYSHRRIKSQGSDRHRRTNSASMRSTSLTRNISRSGSAMRSRTDSTSRTSSRQRDTSRAEPRRDHRSDRDEEQGGGGGVGIKILRRSSSRSCSRKKDRVSPAFSNEDKPTTSDSDYEQVVSTKVDKIFSQLSIIRRLQSKGSAKTEYTESTTSLLSLSVKSGDSAPSRGGDETQSPPRTTTNNNEKSKELSSSMREFAWVKQMESGTIPSGNRQMRKSSLDSTLPLPRMDKPSVSSGGGMPRSSSTGDKTSTASSHYGRMSSVDMLKSQLSTLVYDVKETKKEECVSNSSESSSVPVPAVRPKFIKPVNFNRDGENHSPKEVKKKPVSSFKETKEPVEDEEDDAPKTVPPPPQRPVAPSVSNPPPPREFSRRHTVDHHAPPSTTSPTKEATSPNADGIQSKISPPPPPPRRFPPVSAKQHLQRQLPNFNSSCMDFTHSDSTGVINKSESNKLSRSCGDFAKSDPCMFDNDGITNIGYNNDSRGRPKEPTLSLLFRRKGSMGAIPDEETPLPSINATSSNGKQLNNVKRQANVINMPHIDQFGDAGLYTGEVNDDKCPHGKGKMKYENGVFYEGKWVNGEQDANTVLQRERMLSGFTSWKGQPKNANGASGGISGGGCTVYGMEWIDFSGMAGRYTGTVNKDNLPEGKGIMKYDFGLIAEGEWVKGVLNNGSSQGQIAGGATFMSGTVMGGGMSVASGAGMSVVGGSIAPVSVMGMGGISVAPPNLMHHPQMMMQPHPSHMNQYCMPYAYDPSRMG